MILGMVSIKGWLDMSYLRACVSIAVAMSLSVIIGAGCDMGPKRIKPPSVNSAAAARAAIDQYDTDKNGQIAGEELDKCPALKSLWSELAARSRGGGEQLPRSGASKNAADKPEGITAEMLQSVIGDWLQMRIGRVTYTCQLTRNGRPLGGAAIRFVPEKFMGAGYPVAEGVTDLSGCGQMSIPGVTPEGIAVGFYRVEITKDGENIPAKYNTESTLGVAVIHAVSGVGAAFNLKY